jgi:hypothetical protein
VYNILRVGLHSKSYWQVKIFLLLLLNKAKMNFKAQHLIILPVAALLFLQSCDSGGNSNE